MIPRMRGMRLLRLLRMGLHDVRMAIYRPVRNVLLHGCSTTRDPA
jgi:hypothetical protein